LSGIEPPGSRPLVNSMRALTPATSGARSASSTARSSGLGAGAEPEPSSAAWAMPPLTAITTIEAAIA
jgi:hypothetical protein